MREHTCYRLLLLGVGLLCCLGFSNQARATQVEKAEGLEGFVYSETMAAQLTEKELAWLQQKHRVRVFVAHAPPLVIVNGDRVEGLVIDYLNRLTSDFGVQFEYIQSSWDEAVAGVVNKTGPDLLPIMSPSAEYRNTMAFSDPFLDMLSVIFSRDDSKDIGGLEDLSGLKVALPKGFLLQAMFEKEHPDIGLVITRSMEEALRLLATGKVDAYIGGLMMTSHLVKEMGLENIKVAAPFPLLPPEHVMATRNDWPELISLFNRTLRQMTPRDHNEIRHRWLAMRYDHGVTREEIWRWSGLALAVFMVGSALFIIWNRSLKKEIAQRKSTEEALNSSVWQYQHLVQSLPHGIIEIDSNLQIIYCNSPLATLLGYPPTDLQGKSLTTLICDDEGLKTLRTSMTQVGEHCSFQLQLVDNIQQLQNVQFDLDISEKETLKNQVIIVTDLTRQKQMENALQKSETFYRTTFANIQAGVAHLSKAGQILRVNPYLCRMLGYSESELISLTLRQITHPDDLQASIEMRQQLTEGVADSYSLAKRYLKKDGSPVWGLVSVSLQSQDQGEAGYIAVVQDIDDFKHQQDEVTVAAENLEQIIQQRTAELKERVHEVEKLNFAMMKLADDLQKTIYELDLQKGQLAAANADLESFSYSVSHDLRAPLRHISGFVAMLQETCGAQLDDSAKDRLQRISGSALKMSQMIDDLLTFSRAGQNELVIAPIDMNLLFHEISDEINADYLTHKIDWQIGNMPSAEGDVSTLRQVVVNLLDNAAKYSSKNDLPCIEISGWIANAEVIFRIRDNGVGFDPTCEDKLFKVFQRLHRDDEFQGTGIGLASVRRIVMRHGGWVKGESRPGEGACFSFALPLPRAEDV